MAYSLFESALFHHETSLHKVDDAEQTVWFTGAIDFTNGKASGQVSLYNNGFDNGCPVLLRKYRLLQIHTLHEGTESNEGQKFLKHDDLSTIMVVADVPSMEIDATK